MESIPSYYWKRSAVGVRIVLSANKAMFEVHSKNAYFVKLELSVLL
jgi:hypothetical protein